MSGGNSALDVKASAYLRGSIALLNTPSCTPYAMSVGITAQLSPPSSEAAQSAFLRLMAKGRIVATGGPELALELERNGYRDYAEEAA